MFRSNEGIGSSEPQPDHKEQLEAFCRIHWPRLAAIARRRGCDPHDAEDATQELFIRLIEKDQLAALAAMPCACQQAAHLATRMSCHLIDRWRRSRRMMRGGDATVLRLAHDKDSPLDAPDFRTPSSEAERAWAHAALERAVQRAGAEWSAAGKAREWRRIEQRLCDGQRPGHPQSGAARLAAHRARIRLRGLLAREVTDARNAGEAFAELLTAHKSGYDLEH